MDETSPYPAEITQRLALNPAWRADSGNVRTTAQCPPAYRLAAGIGCPLCLESRSHQEFALSLIAAMGTERRRRSSGTAARLRSVQLAMMCSVGVILSRPAQFLVYTRSRNLHQMLR